MGYSGLSGICIGEFVSYCNTLTLKDHFQYHIFFALLPYICLKAIDPISQPTAKTIWAPQNQRKGVKHEQIT